MVVKTVGNFLCRQWSGTSNQHSFIVGLNACIFYLGTLISLAAICFIVYSFVTGNDSLFIRSFIASTVGLFLMYVTLNRHLFYLRK